MLTVGTNTYVSEADALAYITLMGLTPLSDAETYLKRATRALDDLYWSRYIGDKAAADQPLEWPRANADIDTIPSKVADATVELALMLEAGQDPFIQAAPQVTEESIEVDVIKQSRRFAVAHSELPMYRVTMLLGPYLKSSSEMRLVRG